MYISNAQITLWAANSTLLRYLKDWSADLPDQEVSSAVSGIGPVKHTLSDFEWISLQLVDKRFSAELQFKALSVPQSRFRSIRVHSRLSLRLWLEPIAKDGWIEWQVVIRKLIWMQGPRLHLGARTLRLGWLARRWRLPLRRLSTEMTDRLAVFGSSQRVHHQVSQQINQQLAPLPPLGLEAAISQWTHRDQGVGLDLYGDITWVPDGSDHASVESPAAGGDQTAVLLSYTDLQHVARQRLSDVNERLERYKVTASDIAFAYRAPYLQVRVKLQGMLEDTLVVLADLHLNVEKQSIELREIQVGAEKGASLVTKAMLLGVGGRIERAIQGLFPVALSRLTSWTDWGVPASWPLTIDHLDLSFEDLTFTQNGLLAYLQAPIAVRLKE